MLRRLSILIKVFPIFSLGIFSVKLYAQQTPEASGLPSGILTLDAKVSASSGSNTIEFTPLSSFNNGGVLIKPVNTISNKGVSTAFLLHDTASWSFYTNSLERLRISGLGNITSSVPLLINTTVNDNASMLRVNGNIRADTSLSIKAISDTGSFISFHRNVRNFGTGTDDLVSPYTTTPTAWAGNNINVPAFRIRHPLNVSGMNFPNTSIKRDFMILPYQYGMAIEYNGVVECWVGEWSIHRGLAYRDVEGRGNGWGAVLWVGDDNDGGGVRSTARNNTETGGNVVYGEVSVEKFAGAANGDLRFRLPSTQNNFQFIYGGRGSNNIIAKMKNEGLVIPKISSVATAQGAEEAQLVFDDTDNRFMGYNGTEWVALSGAGKTGTFTFNGNDSDAIFYIQHGLGVQPGFYTVIATSLDAANISYVTADSTNLMVHYHTPPGNGINNLKWNWQANP